MADHSSGAESLSLRKLRVLVAVADREHFSRASEWLNISQPAVSAHVRDLERHLGVTLFRRVGRGARLTDAGRLVYDHAVRLLALADELEAAVAESRGPAGALTIGASTTPGAYLLPEVLATFRKRHPRVRVAVEIANTATIALHVRRGEFHLGVLGEAVDDLGLTYEPWVRDQLLLVLPPRHRWAGGEVEPQQLGEETIIGREEGSATDDLLRRSLAAAGVETRPAIVLGDTEAIKGAVASGLGVAFVSERAATHELSDGRLARCRVRGLQMTRQFQLVRREGRCLSAAEEAFLATARESAR
ncbi:MAG: LysR substrate-binding domain-containing protein [Actinomycetota bacterium]|nr:LysR substrate-binding domain-containing protein [Actinomycetota bacterium]